MCLPNNGSQPPAEPQKTNVPGIVDLPTLPEICYDEYAAYDESDDLSDSDGAVGKPPISMKQIEFSLKQFAKGMGQANYSIFHKWKKVQVAGLMEKHHWSIIQGQKLLQQLRDQPLHREAAVADFLNTVVKWLLLENFNNAIWIRRLWVEIFQMNVQQKFGGHGETGCEATSDRRWICDTA